MQSQHEIESVINAWEPYRPANFIVEDQEGYGARNAITLAELIRDNFDGMWTPANMSDALVRFRDQFYWHQPAQPQPTVEPQQNTEHDRALKEQQNMEHTKRLNREQSRPRVQGEVFNPVQSAVEAATEVRDAFQRSQQAMAKQQAEGVQAFRANGALDRIATEEIQQIVAHRGNDVDWKQTLELRQQAAKKHEQMSRFKRDMRG
jgi:hypothetical protein